LHGLDQGTDRVSASEPINKVMGTTNTRSQAAPAGSPRARIVRRDKRRSARERDRGSPQRSGPRSRAGGTGPERGSEQRHGEKKGGTDQHLEQAAREASFEVCVGCREQRHDEVTTRLAQGSACRTPKYSRCSEPNMVLNSPIDQSRQVEQLASQIRWFWCPTPGARRCRRPGQCHVARRDGTQPTRRSRCCQSLVIATRDHVRSGSKVDIPAAMRAVSGPRSF
jgi:hypothetical protein